MLAASLIRIAALAADARVLDVGGWGSPFARADAVIDVMPYDTRGLYGLPDGDMRPRFTEATWTQRDVCDREPWPYDDDAFDFAVCSHVLEDVRDPLWVAAELSRVAKAGYVEVPAPVEELTFGIQGPWVGWSHHRWISELDDGAGGLVLTGKPHLLSAEGRHLPPGTCDTLTPEQRTLTVWWSGTLAVREQIFIGPDRFDPWLQALLDAHRREPPRRRFRR